MIKGVKITALNKIPDERGTIMHGIRSDELTHKFGETYFKKLYGGVVNGWHRHETLELNYMCIHGMVKLVLYKAETGELQEFFIGEDNYCRVHIPAGIFNGMKGMTYPYSIVCNVSSEPHDPSIEYVRVDPHSGDIPYNWDRVDR